jgi:hypothetical protein
MPSTSANFIIVPGTDSTISLPDPQSGINDFHSSPFDAPDVHAGSPAVLFWQVNPAGRVRVQVNLNNKVVRIVLFDSTPQRSWHEVIGGGLVQAQDNVVDVAVIADDDGNFGAVAVSDFVLMYRTTS